MHRRSFVASACVVGLLNLVSDGLGEDVSQWQNWRGPNRDGLLSGAVWPDSIDENTLKSRWVHPLGDSYSGPVLTLKSVFTTESKAGKERVLSFARSNGQLEWQYDYSKVS